MVEKDFFFYVVECVALNAFISDKCIHPADEHTVKGREKIESSFHLDIIAGVIGNYSSRKKAGRP